MNIQLLEDIGESQSRTASLFDVWGMRLGGIRRRPAPRERYGVWRFAAPAEPPPIVIVGDDAQDQRSHWASRTLMFGLALAASFMVGTGGLWAYKQLNDDTSLALVATAAPPKPHVSPAPAPIPVPVVEKPAVAQDDAPAAPAPMVTLPEDAPEEAAPAPVVVAKAAPRRAPRPAQPAPPVQKAKALAPPQSTLLEACRAMGYHADQCIKRACILTKYGLACRGR